MKIEQFKELIEKGLSLDLVYLLQKVDEGEVSFNGAKINNLLATLERKGYLLGGLLTIEGKELLASLDAKGVKTKKIPKIEDSFEKWWKAYPGTSEFEYRGKKFPGSRALRLKKEECRTKYYKVLDEGVKEEDMLKALEREVTQKKEESIRSGQNKLNFMQNTLTYLNQRTFEPYIELVKDTKINIQPGNSVDI